MMFWKKLKSVTIFEHPRITLIEDDIRLPSGNESKYLRFEDSKLSATTIIAKNADGKYILTKEYSYPVNLKIWQLPGGGVHEGEEPQDAARRELREECNFDSDNIKLIGKYLVDNRRSSAYMYVYLAENLYNSGLEGDIEEEISIHYYTKTEIDTMINNGEIINVHTLASWMLYTSKF